MLTAILIDDEQDCVRLLTLQIRQHCPELQVIGAFTDSREGLAAIRSQHPDIVFLDIEMPGMNGFTLLEELGEISFSLIFITAYNEFALKAFRYSALDYLLKPLDTAELLQAVGRAAQRSRVEQSQINMLRSQLQENRYSQKIAVPSNTGVAFVDLKELSYCEAESNYTRLFLTGGKMYLLSKTLREVQQVLEERNFLRVHRQFLVNLDHIKSYHKGDAAYIELENGVTIPVAKNQKERLVQKFGWL